LLDTSGGEFDEGALHRVDQVGHAKMGADLGFGKKSGSVHDLMFKMPAKTKCVRISLSLLRGLFLSRSPPTACAVGCILAPLRG
jgi:hypothetical protein